MLALFKSHYSIGKSILTLNHPKEVIKGGPNSIFKIAVDNNLKQVILVEDSLVGFFQAYKISKDLDIQLIFGLRLSLRNSLKEEDENSDHKVIIFAKNDEGCKLLNKIYSKAFTEFNGFLDYNRLGSMWNENYLKLAIPFYDSFIYANKFSFCNAVPDFSFTKPTFFIENNGLAFDTLLSNEVNLFTESGKKFPTQKVKSIYYTNKKDAEALMTYKIICNRSFGKNRTISKPELEHFCSDEFSFESWKNKNVKV